MAERRVLSAAQRAAIDARLRTAMSARPAGGFPRLRPGVRPPLSFGQERLWFMEQLSAGVAAFTIFKSLRLRGPLDPGALQRALDTVTARHDSLRMRFPVDADRVPAVDVPAAVAVPVEHLSVEHAGPEGREQLAAKLISEAARQPFDLQTGPLLRAALVRLGPDDHMLLLTCHHIIADGWSLNVLLEELFAAYRAALAGTEPELRTLELGFGDHAARQRERQRTGHAATERHLAFWRAELRDLPALELLTERPRPAQQTFNGTALDVTIGPELTAAVAELGRAHGATLFMTLLAAWQAVLGRHSGQVDFAVGTPVAGRDDPRLEPLIGMFVNVLTLRADLSGDPSFAELLARTRQRCLAAYAHQELPFEQLLGELSLRRDPSRAPLFQALLSLQAFDPPAPSAPGLTIGPASMTTAVTRTDLELHLVEGGGRLQGDLVYNTDLFAPSTAARLVAHLIAVLEAATAHSSTPLSRLDLLPADERRLVVHEFAEGPPAPRTDRARTLPERLRAQANATPGATAVVAGDREVGYAELLAAAEAVAARLTAAGAGPGTVVAVCAERSLALYTALLGVLLSGAAYLPLDPAHPPERLAQVIGDAGAQMLITRGELAETLPPVPHTLRLDADEHPAPAHGAPHRPAAPDDLAYVIYTSGSTGRPKGVEIEHRALLSLLDSMARRFATGPGDVWLWLTTPSFDLSKPELYVPLLTGGRLVIADEARDGAGLLRLIRAHGVTHVEATPSTWRLLLEAGFDEPGVTALVGGEALPLDLARALRPRAARLSNMYGPTEATVWATTAEVPADSSPDGGRVTIGRPLDDTRVYVLDAALRPVPIGVPGELCIAGPHVARGYRGRPAMTAERFVPDPFGPPGSRLYRTGDVVRWRADGDLEFHGRADGQVKLRGYRIELGEIEAVLATHPAVGPAAARVHPDGRLAGYVVPVDPAAPPAPADLAAHLQRHLPAYMVPVAFVVLDRLPLTPNGKLDRGALPEPSRTGAAGAAGAPATALERRVAQVWTDVLDADGAAAPVEIGPDDDFFALGGHSLHAARVVARLRATMAVEVPLTAVFHGSTLREFARQVQALLPDGEVEA
ncbi:amino acid adenylation domain-containing protein [Dactylosporangium vinaceum]|uniref:Non-ribosomal peptide synthetase n=1 Tax=Dactylosporangium vinaceum TaxID=53362 RepID=A0ABV5M464_9ACTN|nr:non-ribosomal peptide synthetase [Dactylosporangium vinaceum]UAB94477.1 amino acid adenylation domain-containing protein [Dactylosporangium vinaceum]